MAKQKEPIEESLEKKLWKTADKPRKNIDASELGMMIDRKNRIFEDKDVKQVADMYQNWLKGNEDIKGFCKSAELVEIEKHKFVLTSVRYV